MFGQTQDLNLDALAEEAYKVPEPMTGEEKVDFLIEQDKKSLSSRLLFPILFLALALLVLHGTVIGYHIQTNSDEVSEKILDYTLA